MMVSRTAIPAREEETVVGPETVASSDSVLPVARSQNQWSV
jgi:hypothetical protein